MNSKMSVAASAALSVGDKMMSIVDTVTKTDHYGPYTCYIIEVTFETQTWKVARRFKHFYVIREKLLSLYPESYFLAFPFRLWAGSMLPSTITYRKNVLQDWLRNIVEYPAVTTNANFLWFIGSPQLMQQVNACNRCLELENDLSDALIANDEMHKQMEDMQAGLHKLFALLQEFESEPLPSSRLSPHRLVRTPLRNVQINGNGSVSLKTKGSASSLKKGRRLLEDNKENITDSPVNRLSLKSKTPIQKSVQVSELTTAEIGTNTEVLEADSLLIWNYVNRYKLNRVNPLGTDAPVISAVPECALRHVEAEETVVPVNHGEETPNACLRRMLITQKSALKRVDLERTPHGTVKRNLSFSPLPPMAPTAVSLLHTLADRLKERYDIMKNSSPSSVLSEEWDSFDQNELDSTVNLPIEAFDATVADLLTEVTQA
eukprot:GILK01008632.1.p1 GENE.GILK01008632.1~~GILK01008632.1.p1  ORF type:complete len:432 (-),score=98.96 GILK01008632.1:149-1444(-)